MDRTEMTPLEAARKRPGMYIGSADSRGLHVLLRNLIEKACDACLESAGGMITVDVLDDGEICVSCNAILSPFSSASDLSHCLQDACSGTMLYDPLSGLNGLWVVNALSRSLTVEVHRAGQSWHQAFRDLQPVSSASEFDPSMEMATILTFSPDETIFGEDAHVEWEPLSTYLSQSSYLIPGVGFRLCDWRHSEARMAHFPPTMGVLPYVVDLTRDQHPLSAPMAIMDEIGQTIVHIAFQYSQSDTRILSFVNNHQTVKHGSHVTGFLNALRRVLKTLSRQVGASGNEARSLKSVTTHLTAVVSVRIPRPSFAGCTTDELSNPIVQQAVYDVTRAGLQSYLDTHPDEAQLLLTHLLPGDQRKRMELVSPRTASREEDLLLWQDR